ncbi:DUF29 domain-containing protein [Spirulina sp. CS-785/01]|uniref:DUF29 domain-containing protein n=1 Tax=Spirulina sp. CS-785/01 TaxID=3021716 RepID=UPI00232AACC7|nr:DUF29 domain-containing protein [Spirulina sp. CS-785/01]MDB9313741.1 DUF29 domain-containing protein [Spirulina sp. CS-785/01]
MQSSQPSLSLSPLYDQDYYLWLKQTVDCLENQDLEALDWPHLIEEIKDLGKNQRRELKNRLIVLLTHLLKWQYQPEQREYYGNSWVSTINEQRRQLALLLEDSPSLKPYIVEMFSGSYSKARKEASQETGLPIETFPVDCPFCQEETLDGDYWPESLSLDFNPRLRVKTR